MVANNQDSKRVFDRDIRVFVCSYSSMREYIGYDEDEGLEQFKVVNSENIIEERIIAGSEYFDVFERFEVGDGDDTGAWGSHILLINDAENKLLYKPPIGSPDARARDKYLRERFVEEVVRYDF